MTASLPDAVVVVCPAHYGPGVHMLVAWDGFRDFPDHTSRREWLYARCHLHDLHVELCWPLTHAEVAGLRDDYPYMHNSLKPYLRYYDRHRNLIPRGRTPCKTRRPSPP